MLALDDDTAEFHARFAPRPAARAVGQSVRRLPAAAPRHRGARDHARRRRPADRVAPRPRHRALDPPSPRRAGRNPRGAGATVPARPAPARARAAPGLDARPDRQRDRPRAAPRPARRRSCRASRARAGHRALVDRGRGVGRARPLRPRSRRRPRAREARGVLVGPLARDVGDGALCSSRTRSGKGSRGRCCSWAGHEGSSPAPTRTWRVARACAPGARRDPRRGRRRPYNAPMSVDRTADRDPRCGEDRRGPHLRAALLRLAHERRHRRLHAARGARGRADRALRHPHDALERGGGERRRARRAGGQAAGHRGAPR